MKSILDGVTVGTTDRADAQDPVVAKADEMSISPSRKQLFWLELPRHV